MTNFSSWNNSSLQTHIDQYFSQPEAAQKFTRDVILWLKELGGRNNLEGVLKNFSFAYYNELRSMQGMDWNTIKSDYTIDSFANPQHTALLNMRRNLI